MKRGETYDKIRLALAMAPLGSAFVDGRVKAEVEAEPVAIRASVRRVARLVSPRARAVLDHWAAYLSRLELPSDLFVPESPEVPEMAAGS